MKLLKINQDNPEKNKLKIAIDALKEGKTVVYPTDTIYGIGANALDIEAIKKVYRIKKREFNKPISICVPDIDYIKKVAYMNKETREIIENFLPGPFTIILKKKENIPSLLTAGGEKIGIRLPDSKVCMELSKEFPITTTSANLSGEKIPESVDGILKQIDGTVDLILDTGICKHGVHSTVIDMTLNPPQIVREGLIVPKFNL
jgi:L-threonylcarbamoyladenylate synthase